MFSDVILLHHVADRIVRLSLEFIWKVGRIQSRLVPSGGLCEVARMGLKGVIQRKVFISYPPDICIYGSREVDWHAHYPVSQVKGVPTSDALQEDIYQLSGG